MHVTTPPPCVWPPDPLLPRCISINQLIQLIKIVSGYKSIKSSLDNCSELSCRHVRFTQSWEINIEKKIHTFVRPSNNILCLSWYAYYTPTSYPARLSSLRSSTILMHKYNTTDWGRRWYVWMFWADNFFNIFSQKITEATQVLIGHSIANHKAQSDSRFQLMSWLRGLKLWPCVAGIQFTFLYTKDIQLRLWSMAVTWTQQDN